VTLSEDVIQWLIYHTRADPALGKIDAWVKEEAESRRLTSGWRTRQPKNALYRDPELTKHCGEAKRVSKRGLGEALFAAGSNAFYQAMDSWSGAAEHVTEINGCGGLFPGVVSCL